MTQAQLNHYLSGDEVIFEGRVQILRPESVDFVELASHPDLEENLMRLVTFTISRVYRGTVAQPAIVETGFGGGDCGFDFETGKDYLVFARPVKGSLETGICSPTDLVERSGPVLRVLRGDPPEAEDLLDPQTYQDQIVSEWTGTACGTVTNAQGKPVREAYIRLEPVRNDPFLHDGGETTSKSDGSFCIPHLDPGKYRLNAETEPTKSARLIGFYPGVKARSDASVIEVQGGQRLTGLNFSIQKQNLLPVRLSVVGGASHLRLADQSVILLGSRTDVHAYHVDGKLDAKGTVSFESVPAGHYIVLIGLDSYNDNYEAGQAPSKPFVLEVDIGEQIHDVVVNLDASE